MGTEVPNPSRIDTIPWGDMTPYREPTSYLGRIVEVANLNDLLPPHLQDNGEQRFLLRRVVTAAGALSILIPGAANYLLRVPHAQAAPAPEAPAPSFIEFGDSILRREELADVKQSDKLRVQGINVLAADAQDSRRLFLGACATDTASADCLKYGDAPSAFARYNNEIAVADVGMIKISTNGSVKYRWKGQDRTYEQDLDEAVRDLNMRGMQDGKPIKILLAEVMEDSAGANAVYKNAAMKDEAAKLREEGIDVEVVAYYDYAKANIKFDKDRVHPTFNEGTPELSDYEAQVLPPIIKAQNMRLYGQPAAAEAPAPVLSVQPVAKSKPEAGSIKLSLSSVPKDVLPEAQPVVSTRSVNLRIGGTKTKKSNFYTPPSIATSNPDHIIPASEVPKTDALSYVKLTLTSPSAEAQPTAVSAAIATMPSVDETLSLPVPAVPQKAAEASAPLATAQVKPAPAPEARPKEEAPDFTSMYSIDENGVVHADDLKNFLINGGGGFRKVKAGDGLPEGLFQAPKSIDGLYSFPDNVTERARLTSIEGAVYLIISAEKVKEMTPRYPGLKPLEVTVILDNHLEHLNAADLDEQLLNIAEAREEFFLWKLSLRAPDRPGNDGAYLHHIITGEPALKKAGDEFLSEHSYSRPKDILQTNHGDEPGGGAHDHDSLDGDGKNGPYFVAQADIPYHDSRGVEYEDTAATDPVATIPQTPAPLWLSLSPSANANRNDVLPVISNGEVPDTSASDTNTQAAAQADGNPLADMSQYIGVNVDVPDVLSSTNEPGIDPVTDTVAGSSSIDIANQNDPASDPAHEEPATDPAATTDPTATADPAAEVPAAEVPEATVEDAPLRHIFTDEAVQAMLPGAPIENIQAYTSLVLNALAEFEIADEQMACYAFATIRPETGTFAPIDEISKGKGKEYGKPDPETGQIYHGRGFIQLTWRTNYENYGTALGIDLVNHPELANDPTNAARILALYLKEHEAGIRDSLGSGDLKRARQIVNGQAAHGLNVFTETYNTCLSFIPQG